MKSIALILSILTLAWTAQVNVTSAWNQKQYLPSGTAGGALATIGVSTAANTACEDGSTEFTYSRTATASLTCLNTGTIVSSLYTQADIVLSWVHVAGTAIKNAM
jgi:hypothetical protein